MLLATSLLVPSSSQSRSLASFRDDCFSHVSGFSTNSLVSLYNFLGLGNMKRKLFLIHSRHDRNGGVMDMLVFMLVAILLPAWILGTLFLTYFSDGQTGSSGPVASGDQTTDDAGNFDGADDPSALGGSEEDSDSDGTAVTNDSADGSATGSVDPDGDFNPSSSASNNDAMNNDAMTAEVQSLQQQIGQLKTDTQSKQDEIDTLSKQREELSEQLKQAASDQQAQAEEYRLKLEQAKASQMQSGVATGGPTPEELANLAQQRDEMQSELTAVKEQFQVVKVETDAQRTEIDSLKTKLAASQKEATSLEEELKQIRLQPASPDSEMADPLVSTPAVAGTGEQDGPLDYRTWTSSRGSVATLAFLRWDDDKVIVVNEEGKEYRLTLNRLSVEDQVYVNGKR